ncbi:MAG: carbamoyltransferase HypF [Verrucomicrobiota bacterium]|nr:carbamoyltransferase HypF [Limisphaera sp.]MDW8382582.1 carbamoyltransferase HypF [Verrucomicrobiota bacterium]
MERVRLLIRGVVQGVGFRPYVHRLANAIGLCGWIRNSAQGVTIEVEGPREMLQLFISRLPEERPPHSSIQSMEITWLDPLGFEDFQILPSEEIGPVTALVMPDIATCTECLRELFDPADRRYFYPFINCTHCGPRFSIITALPYDRPHTTMAAFQMCEACRKEYENPSDRRFHAQPNACALCGPHLALWDAHGRPIADAAFGANRNREEIVRFTQEILHRTVAALREGAVVAVKGLGGFHLMVLARSDAAVEQLRRRKNREAKPFALMFPDLAAVRRVCAVSEAESRLLTGPERPIVLIGKRAEPTPDAPQISAQVAPGNPNLGVMLPYTPLHHLLLHLAGEPVVATSGNLSEEPICTDEQEAVRRLAGVADLFLVHNRPIARHVDDSIVRVIEGREMILRRARGYAPLPLPMRCSLPTPCADVPVILAAGAHLKNTLGLAIGNQAFLSQHIGDLETEAAGQAWIRVAEDLPALYHVRPQRVVTDLHPDYGSTRFAERMAMRWAASGPPHASPELRRVQHHLAHALAVMAENEVEPPALAVCWDGTGLGWDHSIWGGEFFHIFSGKAIRVATFRPFRLPGGDAAAREPRRAALGVLHELTRLHPHLEDLLFARAKEWFGAGEFRVLLQMLDRAVQAPLCSSVGRLFDAVACLLNVRLQNQFEAQAAMELEFLVESCSDWQPYPIALRKQPLPSAPVALGQTPALVIDWEPCVLSLLSDVDHRVARAKIATRFHQSLVTAVLAVAREINTPAVLLGGGCFQNRWLLEWTVRSLREAGFRPYWPQRVPPNDGGIALGQIAAARLGLDAPS